MAITFSTSSTARRAKGFTLVELLVVIGIIVLLVGLALPVIMRAMRTGKRTRTEADLQLIATSLEAYKADFFDYPRFDDDNTLAHLSMQQDRGARLLCRALIGPGPAVPPSGGVTIDTCGYDGADGPGFRIRAGNPGPDGQWGTGDEVLPTGKIYGPYVQPDKFKLSARDATAKILDADGNPILYYPATPGTLNPASYVYDEAPPTTYNNAPNYLRPYYNAYDNMLLLSISELQTIMRADPASPTGAVAAGKSATYTGPYLLWSAGADGIYGRKPDSPGVYSASSKTDDITNFEIPPDLRK